MRVELVASSPFRRIVLETLPAMIGRDASAEVSVDDSFVGHYQGIVDKEGDLLRILDLGSRTGTFVNGRRVRHAAELMPGDRLTVGRTTFVVRYERRPSLAYAAVR
jgi:pSer/pThr/pTyr-binding forkhead associated (FHA) protein